MFKMSERDEECDKVKGTSCPAGYCSTGWDYQKTEVRGHLKCRKCLDEEKNKNKK
jgi:hypothetical protein